ncbi:adhesive plaque matrix protein-like [Plectropomus leopardus]|uniref:adhesive plaque matrix protein-like n=1 Tax=Plectropomus leopardus TaxID=160734 RepID=UPI001C4B8C4B|nr:adhesive plaque matrix protein-like [Plectropomus leopardus]
MAGDDGRGCKSRQAAAVILVLCALARSLTCFSLQGPNTKVEQYKAADKATVTRAETGKMILNGKNLSSKPGSASAAATGNDRLLHVDLDRSDSTGMFERTSQLEDNMANDTAWRRLNPSLHCGQSKMKLKAMGPGAADLKLDMGNARPLPLSQVPETCGYSMRQNALGLILVVPYDGCNVIQEDGNYMLPMTWRETPVKFACPMLTSSAKTPALTTPEPPHQPWILPLPPMPRSPNRHKRHANHPIYYPSNAYYAWYYYYYMNMMTPAPTPGATTTAKPDMTTTTNPATQKPPVYPYNPYYPYHLYPYYPYYLYYPYYPQPVMTTTAKPVTTTAKMTTAASGQTITTKSASTTTKSASTTKTPRPQFPYYPPYYPYYPLYPPGHQMPAMPDNTDIYYYPIIQHYYGRPPYQQTTQSPTPTTAKPSVTTKPSGSSPTKKPTTSSAPSTAKTTKKPCSSTPQPSSGDYPGSMSSYVSYDQLPFPLEVIYNKARKLPDDQKLIPHAGYKSGLEARAHPGFNYWQPVPWFPQNGQR